MAQSSVDVQVTCTSYLYRTYKQTYVTVGVPYAALTDPSVKARMLSLKFIARCSASWWERDGGTSDLLPRLGKHSETFSGALTSCGGWRTGTSAVGPIYSRNLAVKSAWATPFRLTEDDVGAADADKGVVVHGSEEEFLVLQWMHLLALSICNTYARQIVIVRVKTLPPERWLHKPFRIRENNTQDDDFLLKWRMLRVPHKIPEIIKKCTVLCRNGTFTSCRWLRIVSH